MIFRRRGGRSAGAPREGEVLINPALDETADLGLKDKRLRHRCLGELRVIEAGRNRIAAAALGFLFVFGLLSLRLLGLAFSGAQDLSFLEARREPDSPRGDIVDRRGQLLATDLPVFAAFADPARIWDAGETAHRLGEVLPDVDTEGLKGRLEKGGRFVWVARELSPQQRYAVHNLGLPGVGFLPERKRFYPHREITAHSVGYVNIDGKGLSGAEMAFEDAIRDRAETEGPVRLSLDLRLQHVLHDELVAAVDRFQALAAMGIVLDVHSGEVLALSSLPSFDPNDAGGADPGARFNRVTAGVYELGSTLKAFAVATALDAGIVTLEDGYDVDEPIYMGRHRIRDFHPQGGFLKVSEIFLHSSNIGTAKMVLDMEADVQKGYLDRFGLLKRPDFELPGTATPLVPERWSDIQRMTISFGHGLAISPLQLTVGAAALVNGGCRPRPTVLALSEAAREDRARSHRASSSRAGQRSGRRANGACDRVIKADTSVAIRRLMRQVVEEGTGRRAAVEGYPVAGKTGTAEKAEAGGYSRKKLLSSFLGVFPADDPDYVVLVVLDEPQPTEETFNYATGGWTAAPVVSSIIARSAPLLGIQPDLPETEELSQLEVARMNR